MLDNITLENFKGFKKLDNLKIKPITILCGTNSCGKTSILQSILLLKQTLESKNPNQTLLLNGRFVKLGYFKDLIYKKDTSNQVIFDVCFKIPKDIHKTRDKRRQSSIIFLRELFGLTISKDVSYFIDYKVTLKSVKDITEKETEYLKSLKVVDVCIKIISKQEKKMSEDSEQKVVSEIRISNSKDDIYTVKWSNLSNRLRYNEKEENSGEADFEIKFANLFPRFIKLENKTKEETLNPSRIDYILFRLNDLFQIIFHTYTYLGPLRGEPEREYIYRDEIVEIGNKGENAAYLYLSEKDLLIKNHYFYKSNSDNFEEVQEINLQHAVNKWFELMKIKDFEATILNKIIYLNLAASSYDSTEVGIADVGFGVSQIFPIVLEGLRMDKGSTLLLEQPEIHLHPNLQMQLSDYFISLALSGKNIIAETHSDHIINRLVRRIVEDETLNLKDLIGIYFIKPSENGSIFEEINIDDSKGITNWPVDFFDQTANEQMRIMQAGIRKRKNNKMSKNQ
jgi:predicted ATPase